jgi:hypothetical protein
MMVLLRKLYGIGFEGFIVIITLLHKICKIVILKAKYCIEQWTIEMFFWWGVTFMLKPATI